MYDDIVLSWLSRLPTLNNYNKDYITNLSITLHPDMILLFYY